MPIVTMLDDLGRPAWIALMILGFVTWWPVGLAILAYAIGSGRMGCGHHHGADHWQRKMERLQEKIDRVRGRSGWNGDWGHRRSSGNRAFDEYRTQTLRRLEEEQREFRDFLDRLRHARDKSEFDQFMSERRNSPQTEGYQSPQPQA